MTRTCSASTVCESQNCAASQHPADACLVGPQREDRFGRGQPTDGLDGIHPPQLALAQNGDAVANELNFLEQMAVEEDGLPFALEAAEDVADLGPAHRIDAVGWFVENEELRVMEHGLGQPEPLRHALGILADQSPSPAPKPHRFQKLGPPPPDIRHRHVAQPAVILQGRVAGEVVGDAVLFRKVADLAASLDIARRSGPATRRRRTSCAPVPEEP